MELVCIEMLGPQDRHRQRVEVLLVESVRIAPPGLDYEATAFIHVLGTGIESEDLKLDAVQCRGSKRMPDDEPCRLGSETAVAPCGAAENAKAAAVVLRAEFIQNHLTHTSGRRLLDDREIQTVGLIGSRLVPLTRCRIEDGRAAVRFGCGVNAPRESEHFWVGKDGAHGLNVSGLERAQDTLSCEGGLIGKESCIGHLPIMHDHGRHPCLTWYATDPMLLRTALKPLPFDVRYTFSLR